MPRHKVYAYITRNYHDRQQVLVFSYADEPESGTQVPGGSLQPDESPAEGALREVREEVGLVSPSVIRHIGSFDWYCEPKQEWHVRHVFHIAAGADLPDQFETRAQSDDEDNGWRFLWRWMDAEEATHSLFGEQGQYLTHLTLRRYGDAPYRVAVIHGGPGAPGSVASIARELSLTCGVLEPLQTRSSVDGQVEELRETLEHHGSCPVTLIGHSWGAWLAYLVAARYPHLVGKLILVGSGPFEASYVSQLQQRRMSRLSPDQQAEFRKLMESLGTLQGPARDAVMARLGALVESTDEVDPVPVNEDPLPAEGGTFQAVWPEAAELRRSGALLGMAGTITCPVVTIHGADDPHPPAGVQEPLSRVLAHFRFHLLERCGHSPWKERYAQAAFYGLLRQEI